MGLLSVFDSVSLLRESRTVVIYRDLPSPRAIPLLSAFGNGQDLRLPNGELLYPCFMSGDIDMPEALPVAREPTAVGSLLEKFRFAPSWDHWLRHRIDLQIDDLARGEWVGYYNDFDEGLQDEDFPKARALHNIHFTTQVDPDSSDRVLLRAEHGTDRDRVCSFTLDGYLVRSTGLTPLGIAGLLSDEDQTDSPFWLYKNEWVAGEASGDDEARL